MEVGDFKSGRGDRVWTRTWRLWSNSTWIHCVCDSQTHVFFIRILLPTSVIKAGAGEGFFARVPVRGPASVNAELSGS